jgi:hypothetical protein
MDWIQEQTFAKKIGVARSVLVAFRKKNLLQDLDWRIERKQVELSGEATKKISAALGQPAKDPAQIPTEPTGAAEPIELQVTKIYPNPRLLQARTADGKLVVVSVPRNKNFRPLMKLKAWPPAADGTGVKLYRLEGRCPRLPGRY